MQHVILTIIIIIINMYLPIMSKESDEYNDVSLVYNSVHFLQVKYYNYAWFKRFKHESSKRIFKVYVRRGKEK